MSVILTQTVLLASWTGVTSDQTGASFSVLPASGAQPDETSIELLVRLQQAGGATSPTSRVVLDLSMDGVQWFELALDGVSLNADGTASRTFSMPAITRFVRARLDLAGGTPPTVSARVELASDGRISIAQVS